MISQEAVLIIKETLAPYSPELIAVFGSYARNESHSGSDLDLLVRFGVQLNLFDLIGLEQDLSDKLGLKVDLVTENSLSSLIKESVLADLKEIA